MKIFARLTAVVFMILGVLVILVGVYIAVSGFDNLPSQTPSVPNLIPDFSGLYLVAMVAAGGAVGLQGLFLAAIGQVLWLLASIADQTEQTSRHLAALIHRAGQPKQ